MTSAWYGMFAEEEPSESCLIWKTKKIKFKKIYIRTVNPLNAIWYNYINWVNNI